MSTPDRKPHLFTERAVFRPRTLEESSRSAALPSDSVSPANQRQHEVSSLTSGEYRVPILYVGRDELIALLPDHEAHIRHLTDLEIEALALEIEASLTEIYGMVLQIVWTASFGSKAPG